MPPKTKSSRANVYNRDCPSQSILALIGSKWSILVLCSLRAGPRRTHQLKRRLEGVSSKMLTQTLRELERHGIVRRRDFGEVPPRVEYDLTALGCSLAGLVINIEEWVTANYTRMTGVARSYDATVDAR
jgi:DNA-binding HxlR family transcriptional regulator